MTYDLEAPIYLTLTGPDSLSSFLFVSRELSSVRDYVITHSVRSMYVVCMYVCGNLQN